MKREFYYFLKYIWDATIREGEEIFKLKNNIKIEWIQMNYGLFTSEARRFCCLLDKTDGTRNFSCCKKKFDKFTEG